MKAKRIQIIREVICDVDVWEFEVENPDDLYSWYAVAERQGDFDEVLQQEVSILEEWEDET